MKINTFSVNWTSAAAADFDSILEYIAEENPLNAENIFKRIQEKSRTLETFPEKGRVIPELKAFNIIIYRELIISPWRLIYRIDKNDVYVLALFDGRRNLEDVLLERVLRE